MTISATGAAATSAAYLSGAGSVAAGSATATSAGTPAATDSMGTAATLASAALSTQAAIVATLGGNQNSVQIYDASGLLSRIAQIQQAGANAVAAAPASSATSSPDVTANWASILKTRPELAGVAIGYAFDQGIVNTLSTYA